MADQDLERDYIFRVVETRAREKLDAGQISQEEYEQIVQKHKQSTPNEVAVVNETDTPSKALTLLVGDLLEKFELAEITGQAVLLGGSHGNSQIAGIAVLTTFRILFISEDAVNAAQEPNALKLRSRVRVLPQSESFPLHSIQTTAWSKGTSSRMVKKKMKEEGGEQVLEKAASSTVTITSKFGRTIQLLFTESEDRDNTQVIPSSGAPQPSSLFCETLRERLHSFLRSPGSILAQRVNSSPIDDNTATANSLPLKEGDLDAWYKWRGYDPVSEYKRLGVDTSICKGTNDVENTNWSMTRLNEGYEISPTYPALLAIPSACSIEVLKDAARFRSKGRIPSLSWRCTETGVTLSRCAQPLSGFLGRNRSDEALVRNIWFSSASPVQTSQGGEAPHLILDCRPFRNAQANAVAGRGYENMAVYGPRKAIPVDSNKNLAQESENSMGMDCEVEEAAVAAANEKLRKGLITEAECEEIVRLHQAFHGGTEAPADPIVPSQTQSGRSVGSGPICELVFADIENIHVQRRCFREVLGGCNENDNYTVRSDLDLGAVDISANDSLSNQALSWLKHVSSVLTAARGVVTAMRLDRRSVLVHCSDGWDRTPQITSLVSLLLDPYYRTIKGFCLLIEKEWLSYGHAFAERMGHGKHKLKDTIHLSPIFYQWIDCVWQVTEQLPHHFEFDSRLLLALLDLMVSCHFGNFFYNCERERVANRVFETTESVWDYIDAHRLDFENPLYFKRTQKFSTGEDITSDQESSCDKAALFPVVSVKRLRLWTAFFHRWDPSSKPKVHAPSPSVVVSDESSNLQVDSHLGTTEMLIQRIAELERQLNELQPKVENAAPPPPALVPSKRFSTFASQRLEGADAFTRRHCDTFIGSVHGYAWTTISNSSIQDSPIEQLDPAVVPDTNEVENDESGPRVENGRGRAASNAWVPDELAVKCAKCTISFTVFTRRHHCRGCGHCFCSTCAPPRRVSNGSTLVTESTESREASELPSMGEDVIEGAPLSKNNSKKERLCLACYHLRAGRDGTSSTSFSTSLGKAMRGWSKSLTSKKSKKSSTKHSPKHTEDAPSSNNVDDLSEEEDDDDDDVEGAIMLDEFEADVDQRVSVLKAAGLLEFLDPLTEFGFETIEDLLEPGLVNGEDLMGESINMTQENVHRFRQAIGDYRKALGNFSASSRMSAHFM